MPLEVRHIKAENTHENKQFRRVARHLIAFFEQRNWNGILIGNPESENFRRFRADAILLYNHGLVIIDFKDYSGTINLPTDLKSFKEKPWYIDTEDDKKRIIIKAGSYFANPFKQLNAYRSEFFDVVKNDITLKNHINPSHVCALNIFSGPIELDKEPPGNLRYYALTTEKKLLDFLVDYSSENSYSDEAHNALVRHFPADLWEAHNVIEQEKPIEESSSITEIDGDLEVALNNFLGTESSGIMVLKSMDTAKRDSWMRYVLENGMAHEIPQIETWVHSTRIARRVKSRSGMTVTSIYAAIYGGKREDDEEEIEHQEESDEKELFAADDSISSTIQNNGNINSLKTDNPKDELKGEKVPIASDKDLDEGAVIIIQDAHLVTSSLHRSDLLVFGTGMVLTDLIHFMRMDQNHRKIIFIGDPYSLSYGKIEESALAEVHLNSLYSGDIQTYNNPIDMFPRDGIENVRGTLAKAIEKKTYNKLTYADDDYQVILTEVDTAHSHLREWFSRPLSAEPKKAGLFYKRESAFKANLHIKEECLNNTNQLNTGDLLLVDNNVHVPDMTGFSAPLRIYNGMFVRVEEVLEEKTVPIKRKGTVKAVPLEFIKIKACCISLEANPMVELWMNKNYFESLGKLGNEEMLAFKIFRNIRLSEYQKKHPFESSLQSIKLEADHNYKILQEDIDQLKKQLGAGERVKTKLEKTKRELRKIENKYKRDYRNETSFDVLRNDPFVNAINACYGWCTTVHKAVGAQFEEVIFNVNKGLNQGIINEDYFRWVYSGMTTAQDKVYVTNLKEIDPFMNCGFEDLVDDGWSSSSKTQNTSIEFEGFETPSRYVDKIVEEIHINAKGAIAHFADAIDPHGILLVRTRKFGDYLSKAFFSTPNDSKELIMVFNNNGKGKVTSIRIERNGAAFKAQIAKVISEVKNAAQKEDVSSDTIEMPEDFRKEIYEDWVNRAQMSGAQLKLVGCHSYHDIFVYSKGEQKIKFKLIYNGKGMFSHIKVLAKTDSNISIELHELVFHGD